MKKNIVSLFGVIAFMFVINVGMASAGVMTGWVLNHANDVDVDNDKVITIDELLAHGRDAIIVLDKNEDGKLTQDELHAGETAAEKRAYANPLGLQPGWILVHADRLDTDEDGVITRLEIIMQAVDAVKFLDKNLDSALTGDECPKLATGEESVAK
jgi:hypothetical protein